LRRRWRDDDAMCMHNECARRTMEGRPSQQNPFETSSSRSRSYYSPQRWVDYLLLLLLLLLLLSTRCRLMMANFWNCSIIFFFFYFCHNIILSKSVSSAVTIVFFRTAHKCAWSENARVIKYLICNCVNCDI